MMAQENRENMKAGGKALGRTILLLKFGGSLYG